MKASIIKHKGNGNIESASVCFISITKTVISFKYMLDKYFQEILCRIDNWINEESGWITESVDTEHMNICSYSPLSGSTCLKLPSKLKKSMKDFINIKNNDNKCFLWGHIRHLNPLKINPERIIKADKNMVNDLDCKGIEFPISIKGYSRNEQKKIIFALIYFVMKMV